MGGGVGYRPLPPPQDGARVRCRAPGRAQECSEDWEMPAEGGLHSGSPSREGLLQLSERRAEPSLQAACLQAATGVTEKTVV